MPNQANTQLPPELLAAILDHTSISQLLRCSHVSTTWRAIARAHPVFWRNIWLRSLNSGSLELFLDRLRANTSCSGINVYIHLVDLRGDECQVLFRYIVLPAILDNLFRIVYLCLECGPDYFSATLDALTQPASMLKGLSMVCKRAHDPEVPTPRLSSSFLGGDAPNLRNLNLYNVVLPDPSTRIPILQTVETLSIRHDWIVINFVEVFAHFPAVQKLSIIAPSCVPGDRRDYVIKQPLTFLDIFCFDRNYRPFFSAFRARYLSAITHIICPAYGEPEGVSVFLRLFEGPLRLTLLDRFPSVKRGSELRAVFSSAYASPEAPTRSFDFSQRTNIEPPQYDAVFTPEIRARVTVFRLFSLRALIVPSFGEFPSCEVVELRFDDRRLHLDPLLRQLDDPWLPYLGSESDSTQFPAVRTIVCSCDSPATITVETLSLFLASVLGPQSCLQLLRMTNIQITGDVDALKHELRCEIEL